MRRRLRIAAAVIAGGCLAILLGMAVYVAWPLPEGLTQRPVTGIRIEDRHGLVLRSTRAGDGRLQRWMSLDELDPDLIAAFLAVEDHRFFDHHGVDLRALVRAFRDNLRGGRVVSGASTITMQLARIEFHTPHTLAGKWRQILQALRLEAHLDKAAILEQYLNRVPLGQGTAGVPAAAALYFGRSAGDVSLGQAALLAGMARAPSGSNPLSSPSRARERRAVGLARLQATGYIGAADLVRAAEEPLLGEATAARFLAPHFTSRLLESGIAPGRDGVIRTGLDLGLQQTLEAEVRHTVQTLRGSGARHAALVVLDNRSGEVLAWVGSPDFFADTAGQVDMVVSPRQPGSALKPFLYGLAFDRGYTPASVLPDIAHTYVTSTGPYRPRNYDRRYHGPVRAREALASSFNIPAVELTERLTAAALLETLHRAGFLSLARSPEHYGLGLALGNGDVTLLELANGYRALANGGEWRPVTWRRVPASDGAVGSPVRVMSEESAALVLDILRDPVARIPGFGLNTPFDFPFPVAAKTGTSRHFTDNWAVGTTRNFTVAVWVGNFSGEPMDRVSGVTGAGPLLHRAVLAVAARYAPGNLPTPAEAGAVPVTICSLSGLRAGPHCPHQVEWFPRERVPATVCDWHREGELQLPAEYQEWAARNHAPAVTFVAAADSGASRAGFRITSPGDGDIYQVPPGVDPRYATIPLRVAGAPAGAVEWRINGERFRGGRWPLEPGDYQFVAVSGNDRDSVRVQVLR